MGLLLSEDPATSRARKLNLYHAALAGVATGHHAHSSLTRYVSIPGASLAPIVDALEVLARAEKRGLIESVERFRLIREVWYSAGCRSASRTRV